MSRRRALCFGLPLLLIAIAVAAWFILARRDADFRTIGPKTRGMRENFARLETLVDPAEFRDCKTVEEALRQLNFKLEDDHDAMHPDHRLIVWLGRVRVDNEVFAFVGERPPLNSPFQIPADTPPMPLKQFLRMTFAQTGVPDVNFIVRGHTIEATTAQRAQEERARHFDSVSVFDRMRTFWKEMTGDLAEDEPEFLDITVL